MPPAEAKLDLRGKIVSAGQSSVGAPDNRLWELPKIRNCILLEQT